MISGSFFNRMGPEVVLARHVDASELSMERAVSAYKQGIALPDVAIADRNKAFIPKIVGEDGAEIGPERRAQLMRDAGVKPMYDENGNSNQQDYTFVFEDHISSERWGKTAEENREGYRVVQVRELELELDVDERTVESSKGGTHVPELMKESKNV